MKKLIFIGLLLLQSGAFACDICGCGVGNQYIGILPEFRKHIFGLRYRTNSMISHLGDGGSYSYMTSREHYHTMELWGGWNIGRSFRVMASLPYTWNSRLQNGTSSSKQGMGDVQISAFYNLLNKKSTIRESALLVQSLWIGGGVKLPTGLYKASDKSSSMQQTNLFQLGTGSVDYNLSVMYDIRLQDAGLNLNAAYRFNTINKYEYGYGNKFSISPQLYYKWRLNSNLSVAPNAGIMYEHSDKDIDNGFLVDISGGNLMMGMFGIECTYRQLVMGVSYQSSLSQNLAGGSVAAGNRGMLHLGYSF